MGNRHIWAALVAVILVAGLVVYIAATGSEMLGYCKGKGYDGYQAIDGKWHCYRTKDNITIAVPIKVLKGE